MDNSSLAHSKWNCKYHIVFAPKYRRQIIYGKIKSDIGAILRKLCDYLGDYNFENLWITLIKEPKVVCEEILFWNLWLRSIFMSIIKI